MESLFKQIKFFIWLCVVSLILVIVLSIFQYLKPNEMMFSLFNNIAICILTSALIVLFQSSINFIHTKKECIFLFYKECVTLENKIILDPYLNNGFILPENGLDSAFKIIDFFNCNVRYAFYQIYFSKKFLKTALGKSIKELFMLYEKEISLYNEQKKSCMKAIKIREKVKENPYLERNLIDKVKTDLQNAEKEIEDNYNDLYRLKKSSDAYKIIENYLYRN